MKLIKRNNFYNMSSMHSKKFSVGTDLSKGKMISSQNPNSFANGLSTKAQNAMRSAIAGSDQHTSPYRAQQQARARPSVSVKIPTKDQTTIESRDQVIEGTQSSRDRGFMAVLDQNSCSYICGSPVATPGGSRFHRGYSLLNQPVNIAESDDSQDEANGETSVNKKAKQVTVVKKPHYSIGYSDKKKPLICPDLLFQGYGIQPEEPLTVEIKRMRRQRRHKERLTMHHQGQNMANIQQDIQEQSSQNLTSITYQKNASLKLHPDINHSSAIDSIGFQTQSPRVDFATNDHIKIQQASISSAYTKGVQNEAGMASGANGWLPFQTQSISIPQHTIEVLGVHTFRSNGEQTVRVSAGPDSYESKDEVANQNQILAQSHTESKSISKAQLAGSKQILTSKPVKKSPFVPQANQKKTINRITSRQSPVKNQVTSTPSRTPRVPAPITSQRVPRQQPTPKRESPVKKISTTNRGTPIKQKEQNQHTSTLKQKEAVVSSRPKKQDKEAPTTPKDIRNLSKSPLVSQRGRVFRQSVNRSPAPRPLLNKPSNASVNIKSPTANKVNSDFKMGNIGRATSNWQNSSQDQILINDKIALRNGSKQQPPIQPGLKRFKTQTRESQNLTMSGPPQLINQVRQDEVNDTSSFAEDLSVTHKIEGGTDSVKKQNNLSPNLALIHIISGNDELGKVSDAIIGELSIVESDGSNHGNETPAYMLKSKQKETFNDFMVKQQRNQSSNQQSKTHLMDNTEDDANTTPKLALRHSRTHIQIQETDNSAPNSPNEDRGGANSKPEQKKTSVDLLPLPAKKSANYMSSTETKILAQSQKTSPHDTVTGTIISNPRHSQHKEHHAQNLKMQHGETLLKMQKQSVCHSQNKRDNDVFDSKRISSHAQAAYKRSNTRKEKQMQRLMNDSSKRGRIVNDMMPLQNNTKAKQNQVRQTHQFIDSDFDNHSVQRITQNISTRRLLMGSTSPVSSKASGIFRQQSIRTRKSLKIDKTMSISKDDRKVQKEDSSQFQVSDSGNGACELQTKAKIYAPIQKRYKQSESIQKEITKQLTKTDKLLEQNQKRILSRLYQKKFIERREKQVQIINKHLTDKSDSESHALAYAVKSQYDYSNFQVSDSQEMSKSFKNQAALATLRKVQDSFGTDQERPLKKNQSKYRTRKEEKETQMSKLRDSVLKNSLKTSLEQPFSNEKLIAQSGNANVFNSYQSLATNKSQIAQEKVHVQPSILTYQPLGQSTADDQQADFMTERGGPKLTSDESTLRNNNREFVQEQQQASGQQSIRDESPPLNLNRVRNSNSQNPQKQFKVPKVRAPQNYQSVVERKYNMVQNENETYFVPGRASRSVYATKPQQKNQSDCRQPQQSMVADQFLSSPTQDSPWEKQESPRAATGLGEDFPKPNFAAISNRKKSHELTSIRNKYNTDEDRLNKLANHTIGKKLERNRQLQVQGRDDPSNLVGFQKLPSSNPQTMRQGLNKRQRAQLGQQESEHYQLVDLTSRGAEDKMSHTIQKNIYGMLNDLNRAKTMRFQNQVLREQQQQFHAVQQRREHIQSQEGETVSRSKLASLGHSVFARPNLQIQTMPSIPALKSNSSIISASNSYVNSVRGQKFTPNQNQLQLVNQQQRQSSQTPSRLLIDSNSKQHLVQQQQCNSNSPVKHMQHNNISSNSAITPLRSTGLRIIQTNSSGV